MRATLAAALLIAVAAAPARAEKVVLDDFQSLEGWTATASEGTHVWLTQEPGPHGMAMRIGFDLNGGGGYVIVRKAVSLTLPENYAFSFDLRGEAHPNNFEFKLVDARGRNVWWDDQRDYAFPRDWQRVTIRKSRIAFAWGPGGDLKQVGAIEIAISAGEGGSGSIWIGDLEFEPREPAGPDGVPDVQASTSAAGHDPALVLDGGRATGWESEPVPREQWLTVDFRRNREFGGLVIDWDAEDYATAFDVQVSNDGAAWTTAYHTVTGHGGRDYIYMPDAESRFVRLLMQHSSRGRGYGIRALAVEPVDFSASPNRFFEAIARDAPAGMYPKYLYGRQTYWTVVGVDGDGKQALLNEEGMLEVDRGAFSIEPFLHTDAGLITWDAVRTSQQLDAGSLPIPSVVWDHGDLTLTTTAFAAGQPGKATLYARYRVENRGERGQPVELMLAIRPFQVNPPWQTVNAPGGVTHIREIRFDGRTAWVDQDRAVVSLTPPDYFGAATFEEGRVMHFLARGTVPPRTEVTDPFGFASGAFQYNLYLEPKAHAEVDLAIPFQEPHLLTPAGLTAESAPGFVAERQEQAEQYWERLLDRVDLTLPPAADAVAQTLRTNVAYILINRDGPALRPGPRNYARSWIRDGALMATALLETGFPDVVRDFLRWYAAYQFPDGKVPCCVDRRGADPVPEHDSPGAFVYAIAEYYRFTHDVGLVNDLWPQVVHAVEYLEGLRKRRLTEEYRAPDKQAFYGLLPESISHEGYSAHPVHSYWDDFFALRGLTDAAMLAVAVGDDGHAAKFAALRDAFRQTLGASIARTLVDRGIDYVPGSVELGDFDPTSTAIALTPGGDLDGLPEPALRRTFDRYWEEFERRRADTTWDAYSPYEVRNVGALVLLGERSRAITLLDWLLADRRPVGWNEWAEIAGRDPAAARFIGDMPHTWVGAEFIRSARTLFAYEREADGALVLGAGVPAAWVTAAPGVAVKRLPTYYGVLSYSLRAEGPDTVRLRLGGDVVVPPGKIVVVSPLDRPLRAVTVDGQAVDTFTAGQAVVARAPADVVLSY
ncbi:MAG TPA: discoidin domain-containing protein [Candidatus Binatia bacterium]|nr:discoidin domain-containing protein [Candidatus Binatia bacterium]